MAQKEARDKAEAKYKIADVDGRKEGVSFLHPPLFGLK